MIASLTGTIQSKQDRNIVININGIGYLVFVPRGLAEKIQVGEETTFFTHMHVREDELSLYGFATEEEWKFFCLLLTVSGVGPKSALEILNAPIAKVKNAIVKKDLAVLTQMKGVGKKTAERIFVDLSGKIKEQLDEDGAVVSENRDIKEDIVQALVSLGYHRQQVIQGLKKIPEEVSGEEAMIKYFLRNI